jgi:glycosyltransferase involved in cell wall biosynthesis
MSPRVSLVATTTATDPGTVLAARLHHLVAAGWDARLHCKGAAWPDDPALADPTLRDRVDFAPPSDPRLFPATLLRRPGALARYLRSPGSRGPFDGRLLDVRPDLIHFHSGAAAWKGMRLKALLGCRVVVGFREDGRDLPMDEPYVVWEGADVLLFPSQALLDRAVARGCPPARAEVVHPPTWRIEAGAAPARGGAATLRLLSVGSVQWEQGLEHAIHAVRLLLDRGVRCEYRIVGDGSHMPAVAFARRELGLTGHVQFVAPDGPGQVVEEMRRADAYVDAAVSDSVAATGLATAQLLGRPFVATRRPSLPPDAGIAVPRRSPGAIADGLDRLAADPGLRARMGLAGQRHAGAALPTMDDHVVALEGIYRRVLEAPRAG